MNNQIKFNIEKDKILKKQKNTFAPIFQKFPEVEIKLNAISNRNFYKEKDSDNKCCIFANNDHVGGEVSLNLKEQEKFEHYGISIELIGKITTKNNSYDSEFLNLSKELEAPGTLEKSTKYNFSFKKVNMPYESYNGEYSITEKTIYVFNPILQPMLRINPTLGLEIGIQDKLNFSIEIFQQKFHLSDCILGKVMFKKVKIPIKSLEAHLYKKEILFNNTTNNEMILISKFEIIDGQPYENDIAPLRLFIGSFDLTPTYKDINSFFSVKYYLKFLLNDNNDKVYTKEQEIILYRANL